MLNEIQFIGRLTKDPEIKGKDNSVCILTLAVDRDFTNQQGERETDFIQCKAFKKLATNCSQYLSKGRLVYVKGRVQTGSYEKDGKREFTTEFILEKVKFLESNKTRNESTNSNRTQNQGRGNQVPIDEPPFDYGDPFANGTPSDEPWPY